MRRAIVPEALQEAAAASGFSPAVRAGDFLYFTGATGGDAQGVMPPDAEAQARNALGKLHHILTTAGASPDDVVEITSYHRDIDTTFAPIETVIRETFAAPLPAWTAVEVAKLRRPGALIEFRVIAHSPEKKAAP